MDMNEIIFLCHDKDQDIFYSSQINLDQIYNSKDFNMIDEDIYKNNDLFIDQYFDVDSNYDFHLQAIFVMDDYEF